MQVKTERELGWAESIGFNCMRVYLHHLARELDKEGFKKRMNDYLTIADKNGIKTIFVFFDDCWNGTCFVVLRYFQTGRDTVY